MIDEIFIGGRRTGRTTRMIKKAAENNIYIVVANRGRALCIDKMAREMGLSILFPITVWELKQMKSCIGRRIREVYVDDADAVLEEFIGTHVSYINLENPVPIRPSEARTGFVPEMDNDLISRSALKEAIRKRLCISSLKFLTEQERVIVEEIDNVQAVTPEKALMDKLKGD